MVKVLSILVFVFSFVQSYCEVSSTEQEVIGDLTIHCGQSDTSIVNITYYGDITMMFIEDKYEECSSEEISPAHHVIYNINGRDCGFLEFNHTNTWTVTVRLQKGFLVTAADKKVNLVCAYDDGVVGGAEMNSTYDPVQPEQINTYNTENIILQNEAQIKDTVINVLSDMIDGQTNITVEVLDKNGEPVTVLYPDHVFRLRIRFPNILATLFVFLASSFNYPIVEECIFSSSSQENVTYLIDNGCGNIRLINFFHPIEISEVDSGRFSAKTAQFKIPKIWLKQHDSVSIICKVIICKKLLQYSQQCPLPVGIKAAKKGDILKIEGRTSILTLKRIWLPSIPPAVVDMEKQTAFDPKKPWSYLPYIILIIVFLVLVLIFVAITCYVIRKQFKANKAKDIIKQVAVVDPNRPILFPMAKGKKKKPKLSKASKSWLKKLQSQQIAGVGYPCLQPTNYLFQNPNQPYQFVNQPLQMTNQQSRPAITQSCFAGQPTQNTNNKAGKKSKKKQKKKNKAKTNLNRNQIGMHPYQTNASIYSQQNPHGNALFQTEARSQPYQTNTGSMSPSANRPFEVLRPNPNTHPMQFTNTGFPQLPTVSQLTDVQGRAIPQPGTMNSPQIAHPSSINHPVPTYIDPRAQSYPARSNAYGNNPIYGMWPPDRPREVPIGFSGFYPPPMSPNEGYPAEDPRYFDPRYQDPYQYRDVSDDRYRSREESPDRYNSPLVRTRSLMNVLESVVNDDRRRRPRSRRRSRSDFEVNIPLRERRQYTLSRS